MQAKRCIVCGKVLTKSEGPIGPRCLSNMRPKSRRKQGMTKAQYVRLCEKYDLFKDAE